MSDFNPPPPNILGIDLSNVQQILGQAAVDVLLERLRQGWEEGYSPTHDDEHQVGELVAAALCYCMDATDPDRPAPWEMVKQCWPWGAESWRPTTPRRGLVKAVALLIAEIERVDRLEGK